ncbi:MAG: 3-oxoacyl-ACP reductase FabG [Gammaproteobacteria bacterium]|nr:3-oxoacyl-ACP reductase FabG [Gammaproteobacteria bacterium]MBU6509522.1 3-oxoacyl-ACP reductase FabG [Gammaproteobacteria bacterium]MDE1984245.1 3-oxoacyl-ACP reductase FabG [Gammaproteobacteria bacterium]MDE2108346.1 3-oxoacyl-ACP reductase FabG [Gammaproteobacteria bacterium]MDE2461078.1 3-oxoacyl-ACP reductase FabG [Gammaproteobacteria bacterium]
MSLLQNEIALVTGATRGIGRAIALALGKAGATVIGTATTADGATVISSYLAAAHIVGRGWVLDVANSEVVEQTLAAVTSETGSPTILVNNAGIARDTLLMRMQEEDWQAVINTDLNSVFRLSKACIRGMLKARHGRIINISSVVAATGNPGQANYAAAKAGVLGFTKSLAREIGSRNITVNTVAPGFIDTDMTRALSDAQRAALLNQIPLGRLGLPDDVAQAVLFLASPAAAYITGETLHVNGGMYMA